MTANAVVWWASFIALLVVIVLIGLQAARALKEVNRLKARVAAYADLPLFTALAGAEANAQRLEGALGEVAPLIERARTAIEIIRRGPVPPELIAAAKRLGSELAALRTLASR